MWLAYLPEERSGCVIRSVRQMEADVGAQRAFLQWLRGQTGFSDNAVCLAGSQLVQCQGFANWSELRHFSEPVLSSDFAVNGLFLIGRNEHDPGIVKSLVGTFGPRIEEGEQRGKLLPLNFTLCSVDEEAWLALEEARHSAVGIFGLGGIPFWLGYVAAGDFLPLTICRTFRLLLFLPKIRKAFRERNVYLRINTRTGAAVAGPSLALAACIATVLAAANLPGDARSKFLSRFLPHVFGGLVGCALTGKLKHGRLEPVDGIRNKLIALRDTNDIRRAVVPKENATVVDRATGQSILDPFVPPASLCGRRFVLTALWSLTPIRKTWLILNASLVLTAIWGAAAVPDWLETHYFRPFSVSEVRTSRGRFSGPTLASRGIVVGEKDRVTVSVLGHDTDGPANLSAECLRGVSPGTERQALRATTDGGGDWRSEVTTPIRDGSASFDFERSEGSQDFCSSLSFSVIHRGRKISHIAIPVRVDGEKKDVGLRTDSP